MPRPWPLKHLSNKSVALNSIARITTRVAAREVKDAPLRDKIARVGVVFDVTEDLYGAVRIGFGGGGEAAVTAALLGAAWRVVEMVLDQEFSCQGEQNR